MTEQLSPENSFHFEIDENQIALIRIRTPNAEANWLSLNFISELRYLIGKILYTQAKGVILYSDCPNTFIQGLKPSLLQEYSEAQLLSFSEDAQNLMRELNMLKVPVIAAIEGNCFGVGLELALACDYRIAAESVHTQFAMPQVRSGLLPFAGGTQRLPRLIGLWQAANLLLTGEKINTERALKLSLIDQIVPSPQLLPIAYQLLLNQQVKKADPKKTRTWIQQWRKQLEGNTFLRNKLLDRIENQTWQKTFGHYPAITELLELLKEPHFRAGLKLEQVAFAKLLHSNTSKVLIDLQRTERLMRDKYRIRGNVRDVSLVTILGSGYIGADIAYLTAFNAKIPVRIKDIHPSEIQKALQKSYALMQQAVKNQQLSAGEMLQRMNLITGGERLVGAKSTDFVIQTVYENLPLKQQLIKESESYYSEQTILATNTSTFRIAEIAKVAERPQNVIGFHYFSPVIKQKMVEIIPHEGTCEHTIATAIHFAIQQGKIPLLVSDSPGGFINRLLMPFLNEAIHCLVEGESIEFIDRALQEFGFEIGPLAMIDEMGIDILTRATPTLAAALGQRFDLPDEVDLLIRNERKGLKNKRGFYLYDRYNERVQEDKSIYHVMETIARNDLEAEEIVRRCLLRMLNEAAWCLQDNVIQSKEEGNVASVLGIGFPEFLGGIYAYMDHIGAKEIVHQLKLHSQQYGARFAPCDWLIEQAKS